MSTRSLLAAALLACLLPLASAQALTLGTWNVAELDASDDVIDLQFGTSGSRTTLTLRWQGGASDTPGALGIDKFYINNSTTTLSVVSVYVGSISSANDVTSAWLPTNGGLNAGGGFGVYVEKVAEPAGSGGIAPSSLIFVLNGAYSPSSFLANARGSAFAAHVRYNNGCSGWVASGGTGSTSSDSQCGAPPTAVPEPSAALVFAAGLLVTGGALSRRR